jgi:class 3 adenylate cyclase
MPKQRVSSQDAYRKFGDTFRSIYRPSPEFQKTAAVALDELRGAGSVLALGHPEHVTLPAGATRRTTAVVIFVDIRGFTKMSFVTAPEDLTRIVQALTQAAIAAISDGGGYVGEFTGDGVMAYFGDSDTPDAESAMAALETTSLLFKTVEEIVNPELDDQGITPIRIAAGMEYGPVLWSRVGTGGASQVKPIGTATFLAGKLSSNETNAWECKIGGELAKWLPDEYKTKTTQYGPFTVKGQQISRELYLLDWRSLAKDTLLDQERLENKIRSRGSLFSTGAAAASTAKVLPSVKPTAGPRPLKDQPFFGRR